MREGRCSGGMAPPDHNFEVDWLLLGAIARGYYVRLVEPDIESNNDPDPSDEGHDDVDAQP
jgi:hypothetical protein